ncbi:MAG: pyridoxal phosphate-dependent aminotransferase [Bacteroidales bacterium]|nr:pyridoxal phosphate-dependent aminotransferase [Bacteroidales bacterium]
MTDSLSYRVNNLAPSATVAMNQKSNDLKAKGIDIINLSVGEPDFPTPDHIKNAAKKAIDNNYSYYPPVPGYPELLRAVSEKFKRENNLDFAPEQIVVSTGAKNSLANAILALIDKDDEVVIPAPYWVTYAELVKLAEGKNVVINGSIDNDFKVTPQQIEKAITPKTKAFLLCSPNNPSGTFYNKEELEAIARVIEKHPRVFVITDEIYEHINFTGRHESIGQFDFIKDRVVIINGVSKAYAMTGWRIGYMAAPLWLAKACIKLQGQLITGATTIAQRAAIEALMGDQSCVAEMNVAFKRRRDLVLNLIKEIPGLKTSVPGGAFYVFPQVSSYFGKSDGVNTIKSSNDLCLYLLDKAHLATVPGEAFGEPTCIRISFATADENLTEAMARMKHALALLK